MELYMNQDTFCDIMKRHRSLIFDSSDLREVFDLLHELYAAEADALKENEPYATRTINDYEAIAFRMSFDGGDFCDAYEEVYNG